MSEEKIETNMNSFRKKKSDRKRKSERESEKVREEGRERERMIEVHMYQGIELISVDSALWRL